MCGTMYEQVGGATTGNVGVPWAVNLSIAKGTVVLLSMKLL